MFRAIARWFRSLGNFASGRIDDASRSLDSDPHAMRAAYDGIVTEKTKRAQQYKQAVAGLVRSRKANSTRSNS